ncbi:MAG: hypothetical protein IPI45_13115 [Saprospiraceae bacterium]|nr:hypothetical protein [Saprospiraceae bacterium]MBK7738707.1 hypothetical protein [Saprospiraceae bacterium]MBK7912721.1 hypothetical protein [Saprospiraceae bacterium]
MNKYILILLILSASTSSFAKKKSDAELLKSYLKESFQGIQINELDPKDNFQFFWELIIQQELDHSNPSKGHFPQKILLYHKGFKKPNVIVTEGYQVADRIYEASLIFDANQFSVEYRFFANSKPAIIDWSLLNQKQALEDLNIIQTKLSGIYKKAWIATGISKGGTTAALYSLNYPKNLKASIAYVAPFPLAQEDPRTVIHYQSTVGTPECRMKVRDFQRMILNHRKELKQLLVEMEQRDGVIFEIDKDRIIDFAAMEYPFSFWQWGFGCQEIPGSQATAKIIFEHIEEVIDFNYYDKTSCTEYLPAYYQFMTEYGYYGFDTTGVSDLLINKQLSNLEFCPKNANLSYHGDYMKTMHEKATHESRNILYIYGGLDTWTSCAVNPDPKTNALKYVKYNGGHRTRIRDFGDADKQQMLKALKKWTGCKTNSLPY